MTTFEGKPCVTDAERLRFHQDGYLVLRDVLDAERLARMNALAATKERFPADATEFRDFFVCRWGADFLSLVDHPRIVAYLEALVGPTFRLDHDYCIFMRSGTKGRKLHGGEQPFRDFWYKRDPDGTIRAGLTVVTFFLTAARPGDGGFALIPGSHRDNYLADLPAEARALRAPPESLIQPAFEAGDAVIFTEALIHGTMDWRSERSRRVLLYKYCAGHLAWLGDYYDADTFEGVTPLQRRIMRPPYVELIGGSNGCYRTPTLEDA
jgi:ectoine hydroxylase-related dioxygenase (phytanoyl-CoA dioxygenase family)